MVMDHDDYGDDNEGDAMFKGVWAELRGSAPETKRLRPTRREIQIVVKALGENGHWSLVPGNGSMVADH